MSTPPILSAVSAVRQCYSASGHGCIRSGQSQKESDYESFY
jgi:hypothetical protein